MKIDIFSHIVPLKYMESMRRVYIISFRAKNVLEIKRGGAIVQLSIQDCVANGLLRKFFILEYFIATVKSSKNKQERRRK